MDISYEVGREVEALFKEKTKAPGNVHFSIYPEGTSITVSQTGTEYKAFLETYFAKGGIKAKVDVSDGTGRAEGRRFERVLLTQDQFAAFLKAAGAEDAYKKLLEKPNAGHVDIGRVKGEALPSATLYFPSEAAAKAGMAKLPASLKDAKTTDGKPVVTVDKSKTRGSWYFTFPLAPDKSAQEYKDIINTVGGMDPNVANLDDPLQQALGEQTLKNTNTGQGIVESWEKRGEDGARSVKSIHEKLQPTAKNVAAFDPTLLDAKTRPKLKAFRDALSTVQTLDTMNGHFIEALKTLRTTAAELNRAIPTDAKGEAVKQLELDLTYIESDGLGAGQWIKYAIDDAARTATRETFETSRERDAARILAEIDQGKHGKPFKESLDAIRKYYGQKDLNGDGKPDIDVDRDGRVDTSVQVLRRAVEITGETKFDLLVLDYDFAHARATSLIADIKNGKLGKAQKDAYDALDRKFGKVDRLDDKRKIHLGNGVIPSSDMDVLRQIGRDAGVEQYQKMWDHIGIDVNALDDIATQFRQAPAPRPAGKKPGINP